MSFIKKHLKRIIPTIILLICVGLAFAMFLHDNTERIERQNEEYINELTTQRAISVDNLIAENLNFIQSMAYLYGKSLDSPWADVAVIREYEENAIFDMLRFVDASGDNYTSAGVMANLSDRDYFHAGMKGASGVTYVLESRVTGERQIGFYAPVSYEGDIIGVMVGFYGEDYIQKLLEYELFDVEGEGWLCTKEGIVLGSTKPLEDKNETYFAYLQKNNQVDEQTLSALKEAFLNGTDHAFTYSVNGETATGYAVALSGTDWVLVRSFPPEAAAQILNNANSEGTRLLVSLLVLVVAYGIIIAIGIILDNRKTREANRNANDISTGVSRLFERFIAVDLAGGTYRYINALPTDETLPAAGDYSRFCESLFRRIQGEKQQEAARRFFARENLAGQLMEADRVSTRVHLPIEGMEWLTYNFIVIERDASNAPVRLLIVCQDITELSKKEEEEQRRLQQALDAAESASRAKTEFLFNMSHDLRTPMNAIIGYTELAQRDGVSVEEMKGFVKKIDASSVHLLSLINDILEMSRIESGKITLEPEPADLVQIMNEAQEMFAAQMNGKQITFHVDSSAVKNRWVQCDKNRLNRIILNLISNAWKFTGEGGRIDVKLEQTEVAEGKAIYRLHVKDSGIGMSPEFVEKLFTPFERERTSTVSKTQGTGLGLSITKKLVDLMEGDIRVETEQGKGTEFVVTLPFPVVEEAAVSADAEAAEAVEEQDFNGKRLLLVEDNMINREIATMLLSSKGFLLETAENGKEAVEQVAASAPGYFDAVLMDVQMPVMDGYTATKEIRKLENEALAKIPIIAMTANAFQEDIKAAQEAGMDGHIAKPLDVDKMLQTIAGVLSCKNGT